MWTRPTSLKIGCFFLFSVKESVTVSAVSLCCSPPIVQNLWSIKILSSDGQFWPFLPALSDQLGSWSETSVLVLRGYRRDTRAPGALWTRRCWWAPRMWQRSAPRIYRNPSVLNSDVIDFIFFLKPFFPVWPTDQEVTSTTSWKERSTKEFWKPFQSRLLAKIPLQVTRTADRLHHVLSFRNQNILQMT